MEGNRYFCGGFCVPTKRPLVECSGGSENFQETESLLGGIEFARPKGGLACAVAQRRSLDAIQRHKKSDIRGVIRPARNRILLCNATGRPNLRPQFGGNDRAKWKNPGTRRGLVRSLDCGDD